MFWQKIELKHSIIVSFAFHLLMMGFLTYFWSSTQKTAFIPLSYNLNPTGTGRAGIEASRGRFVLPPATLKKTIKTDTTKFRQAAISKMVPVLPTSQSQTSGSSPLDAKTGIGAGPGGGIGSGTGSGGENTIKARYLSVVTDLIEKNKFYPPVAKRMGHTGKVLLKLTLDKNGNILDVEVVEGSSFNSLREASTKIIDKISKFPSIPSELGVDQLTFVVPIQYSLQ